MCELFHPASDGENFMRVLFLYFVFLFIFYLWNMKKMNPVFVRDLKKVNILFDLFLRNWRSEYSKKNNKC